MNESNEYEDLLLQYGELIDKEKILKNDDLICECFLLSVSDLRKVIEESNDPVENIPKWCFDNTCLGHACGSCIKNQDVWKHQL